MSMENPNFLKGKYNLHNAPEVKKSAERTESRANEKVPQNPEAQIQNYLNRLEKIVLDPDKKQERKMLESESRPRALSLLREMIMNKYVRSNKDKMAEGAARVEERAAREMGVGIQYGEQELAERGNIAVKDLEKSLDNWIAYLSDANEPYPVWFRYYAFRSVLDLGDYDKDKGEFTKRSQGSTRLFPDIDRGALAYVEQMVEASKDAEMLKRLQKAQLVAANGDVPKDQLITKEKAESFSKFSFAKQYAEGIRQNGEITPEMREEIRGSWIKYQQGTDPTALWASLQNKGTAWCTKGFATAETQLKGGDFYVYYTLDKQGKPTIPRIAIRMEGQNKISNDVRGVLDSQQNIEGNMIPIMEEKLKEFGSEADRFKKKSGDMKKLTEIEKKNQTKQPLTKEDLIFLYEIENSIEGFGYQKDPRIEEIRKTRNPKEDAPIVLDCEPEQIATNTDEVNENTKAYIGKLEKGIFEKIQKYNIENVFTRFPEGKIGFKDLQFEAGEKTADDYRKAIKVDDNHKIYNYADEILGKMEIKKREKQENLKLVVLSVADLGFPSGATRQEIYGKAQALGLEIAPAEVGPELRIQYEDQPRGEYLLIGMEPMADSVGRPRVFHVNRNDDGKFWLNTDSGQAGNKWDADSQWVFVCRKSLEA